ncbi:unnamed protein product [Amaranthus hypochondriacus]
MESTKSIDSSTEPAPLEEVSLNQEKDHEGEPKSSSETTTVAISDANGSPEGKVKTPKSVKWSEQLVSESTYTPSMDPDTSTGSNPYVSHYTSPSLPSNPSFKERMDTVKNVLGRWGRNVKDAAKKAEDYAGNTWQHLKTNPSFADAAMGRIVHSTKVLAEGGYERIFRQTFETVPEEVLQDSYACYLSTSAGPVMGTLYVSTAKLAFCSDNPLPYKNDNQTDWSYYKVIIPLHQLKAVNPSASRVNQAEKYIQIISVDNHEFWYMGFLNYDNAVAILQGALECRTMQSV